MWPLVPIFMADWENLDESYLPFPSRIIPHEKCGDFEHFDGHWTSTPEGYRFVIDRTWFEHECYFLGDEA